MENKKLICSVFEWDGKKSKAKEKKVYKLMTVSLMFIVKHDHYKNIIVLDSSDIYLSATLLMNARNIHVYLYMSRRPLSVCIFVWVL